MYPDPDEQNSERAGNAGDRPDCFRRRESPDRISHIGENRLCFDRPP